VKKTEDHCKAIVINPITFQLNKGKQIMSFGILCHRHSFGGALDYCTKDIIPTFRFFKVGDKYNN
jgi:hypothetical protein